MLIGGVLGRLGRKCRLDYFAGLENGDERNFVQPQVNG